MFEEFNRNKVSRFNFSLSDNRLVKFNLVKQGELIDVKLIFESVHKKHQFAELLDVKQPADHPLPVEDLKMLNVTWNMAASDKISFAGDRAPSIFQDV